MSDLIYSYLVPVGRNRPKPPLVRGTEIPHTGKLFQMLNDTFAKADSDCNIPIRFIKSPSGQQSNEFRTMMLTYLAKPSFQKGLDMAVRLRDVTTERSSLGLLFILSGQVPSGKTRIVISRFPAEVGVIAEPTGKALEVSFVERVFMKNAHSYKAAVYEDRSLDTGFWFGAAVDRQFNSPVDLLADYWIRKFLGSDFKTTSKAGTKRLAVALKRALAAVKSPSSKEMIVSSAVLSRSLGGQMTSINAFIEKYGLDEDVRRAILAELPNEAIAEDKFVFDLEEFELHVPLRCIELDNGGVLTAPSERFDECFVRETISPNDQRVRFTTIGKIVDQQLKGRLR